MDEKKVREAIEAFQGQVNWLKRIDDKNCKEARRCCIEYFETAIKALEKQLEKKADKAFVKFVYGTFEEKFCPKCNELLDFGKYCPNCGQRIDRSE